MREEHKVVMAKILLVIIFSIFIVSIVFGIISSNKRDFNHSILYLIDEEYRLLYIESINLSESINLLTTDISYYLGELLIDYTEYTGENIEMKKLNNKYKDDKLYVEILETISIVEEKQSILDNSLNNLKDIGKYEELHRALNELNIINKHYIELVKKLDCTSIEFMDKSKEYRISYKERLTETKKLLGKFQ